MDCLFNINIVPLKMDPLIHCFVFTFWDQLTTSTRGLGMWHSLFTVVFAELWQQWGAGYCQTWKMMLLNLGCVCCWQTDLCGTKNRMFQKFFCFELMTVSELGRKLLYDTGIWFHLILSVFVDHRFWTWGRTAFGNRSMSVNHCCV